MRSGEICPCTEEAEHKSCQISLTGMSSGEDHTGKGNITSGIAHILGKVSFQLSQGQVNPCNGTGNATEDTGNPLHSFRANAGSTKGFGLFPGGTQIETVGGAIHKEPQHQYQQQGQLEENRQTLEAFSHKGDVF